MISLIDFDERQIHKDGKRTDYTIKKSTCTKGSGTTKSDMLNIYKCMVNTYKTKKSFNKRRTTKYEEFHDVNQIISEGKNDNFNYIFGIGFFHQVGTVLFDSTI